MIYSYTIICIHICIIYICIYIYEYVCVFMGVYSFSNPTQKRIERKMQFEKTKEYYSSIFLGINLVGKIGSGCCKKNLWDPLGIPFVVWLWEMWSPFKLLINQLDSGERTSMMGMIQNLPSGNLT